MSEGLREGTHRRGQIESPQAANESRLSGATLATIQLTGFAVEFLSVRSRLITQRPRGFVREDRRLPEMKVTCEASEGPFSFCL